MTNKICCRAYAAKEKRNAELKGIRKKIADLFFSLLIHLAVLLMGLGVLFGIYLLVASALGGLFGVDYFETELQAAQRYQMEQEVER